MSTSTKHRVTVYLYPQDAMSLKLHAVKLGTSVSRVVQDVLERHLEDVTAQPVPEPVAAAPKIDALEDKKAQHRPKQLGKPTDRQVKLLGTEQLRKLGYDI
jgi:hypothetical protein